MNLAKAIALILLPVATLQALAQSQINAPDSWGLVTWGSRSFLGETDYQLIELDDEQVLQAEANASASALYIEQRIDLTATPLLQWRWRTDATLGSAIDETQKSGDDYAARIYVVRKGGLAFWRTKALNYVWASSQPLDSRWPNPFAGKNVQMLAVDTGTAHLGQWRHHVRDIKADWQEAFGETIDSLDGIAIMTDTDNSGLAIKSWYADVAFTQQP